MTKSKGTDADILAMETATVEADEPLALGSHTDIHPKKKTPTAKRDKESETRRYGYMIIRFCFWILIGIIVADNLVSFIKSGDTSELNIVVIDLLKTVLLFVLGYLFGKNGEK